MQDAQVVLQTILSRRSIRRYTSEPVSREQIETLLTAAMAAPSGNNKRPWHLVVVQDEQQRQKLSQVHRWARMIADAPLAIAVCAEPASTEFWIDDCSAATQNILIAAQAMGLGSVWIGIHQSPQYQQAVRQVLGLPPDLGVHCLIAIGHPAEEKPPYGEYDARRVHWDRY